ncbi:DarT ssDNA thymidine ADP-ribosyltransferase family protein [Zobellella denitrificans]
MPNIREQKLLPKHPLARQKFKLYDYQDGFREIDWELMNERDYHDPHCKGVCMAECLSPSPVSPSDFFKIYAPTDQVRQTVLNEITRQGLPLEVVVNRGMFC